MISAMVPSPRYMRALYPEAKASRWGLVRAYLAQSIYSLRHLLSAIRLVYRVRRGNPSVARPSESP